MDDRENFDCWARETAQLPELEEALAGKMSHFLDLHMSNGVSVGPVC